MNRSRSEHALQFGLLCVVGVLGLAIGCSPLPSRFLGQSEPGVTLTRLAGAPEQYRDKVVILGGVLVEERQDGGRLWLRLKNRPLDENYHPHRPIALDGPEAGHFWVTAANREQLPAKYRKWARMTVVGRVVGMTRSEPVLMLMYVRGWGLSSAHDDVWEESLDPSYLPTLPTGLHGEFQSQ
jgi:starvation-inducible outer membrane lipoprotein